MIYSRLNGETAETCVEHVKRFIVKNYLKLKIHGKNVKLTNFYYILVRKASGCHLNKNCSNKFSKIYYLHDKKNQVHIKYVHIHNAFGKSYFRYIHVSTLYWSKFKNNFEKYFLRKTICNFWWRKMTISFSLKASLCKIYKYIN